MSSGEYRSASLTLSNGAVVPLQVDASGNLKVAGASGSGPSAPATSTSTVAAQSLPVTWQVPVTTTPRALLKAWASGTAYTAGEAVTNDSGKVYVCITAGTSAGSGGPTGTSLDITDNTAHWAYVASAGTAFKGSLLVQVRADSANTVYYAANADATAGAALSKGGKEIPIGSDGEPVFYGDATAVYVYSTGTARVTVAAYP